MAKTEIYKVTYPDGKVEEHKFQKMSHTPLQLAQDIAEVIVFNHGTADGCKVQRVKASK